MHHILIGGDASIFARGQTWLSQPLPVSTVPNTGRGLFNSSDRGLDEEDCNKNSTCLVCQQWLEIRRHAACCVIGLRIN